MIKSIIAAVVTTAFTGAAFAAAHTAAPAAPANRAEVKAAGAADTATKDASGKTEMNREGKMSPTGQNETSSVAAPKKDGMPGATTGAKAKPDMGSAGATTMDASGKTQANREGRMSPTGQNATTSATSKPSATGSK